MATLTWRVEIPAARRARSTANPSQTGLRTANGKCTRIGTSDGCEASPTRGGMLHLERPRCTAAPGPRLLKWSGEFRHHSLNEPEERGRFTTDESFEISSRLIKGVSGRHASDVVAVSPAAQFSPYGETASQDGDPVRRVAKLINIVVPTLVLHVRQSRTISDPNWAGGSPSPKRGGVTRSYATGDAVATVTCCANTGPDQAAEQSGYCSLAPRGGPGCDDRAHDCDSRDGATIDIGLKAARCCL